MNTESNDQKSKTVHHGSNVKRLCAILGYKQHVLVVELKSTQQTISRLLSKPVLEDETLTKIAKALEIPKEAITNFREKDLFDFIQTKYPITSNKTDQYKFGSIDEEIKVCETIAEYHNLLSNKEKEKIDILEKLKEQKK